MKKQVILSISSIAGLLILVGTPLIAWAGEKQYKVSFAEFEKNKAFYDDPRPYLKEGLNYRETMPPEAYSKLTYDVKTMKESWEEVVGFKAPDLIGKIAPDIKPGVYSYKDKDKHPGLKALMIPQHYESFNTGGPPYAGNFPEIKVVPTKQYFWSLPISKATKKNLGQTTLDEQGYLVPESYVAGYPFPIPSGKFKAQQIIYNFEKKYYHGENFYLIQEIKGFTKKLAEDYNGMASAWDLRLHGRVLLEPYGWYDDRAREQGEKSAALFRHLAPRDLYGSCFAMQYFLDPDRFDRAFLYLSALRRVRKMSTTDTQDAVAGQDVIYEDKEGFAQKLSPNRFPYKFEVMEEREYLVPSPTTDGSLYVSSKGKELRNIEFERRPMYVLKLTQLDKSYVYGERILYFDKETFMLVHAQNSNAKGELYRTLTPIFSFVPEMGMFMTAMVVSKDHIDLHSNISKAYVLPATWVTRENVNIGTAARMSK